MSGMMVYTMYEHWPLNSMLCTLWQVFDFAMCSVSITHLCLISFDRYVVVKTNAGFGGDSLCSF